MGVIVLIITLNVRKSLFLPYFNINNKVYGLGKGTYIALKYCLRKMHLKILQIFANFLCPIKRSPSSALIIAQSTKKVKNLKFDYVNL